MSDFFPSAFRQQLPSVSMKTWSNVFNHSLMVACVSLLVCVAGCTAALPTDREISAVQAGEQVIVLLRVTGEHAGKAYEAFGSLVPHDNVGLTVGGFMTGGRVQLAFPQRHLSDKTRHEGWTYFVLDPGPHILAVCPTALSQFKKNADDFNSTPHWRIDVPDDARLVYAGTLHISREFNLEPFKKEDLSLREEEELAQRVATETLPGMVPFKTALMRPHDAGLLMLRTPPRRKDQ